MREPIIAAAAPKPPEGFVHAVKATPFVFHAGVMATDYVQGLPPEAQITLGLPHYDLPMLRQGQYMLRNAEAALKAAGAKMTDSVAIVSLLTDGRDAPFFREVRNQFFKGNVTSTAVIVPEMPVKDAVAQIDIIALSEDALFGCEMINTDKAPMPPGGRYPQAIKAGPWIFTAGQIPTDFTFSVAPAAQIDPNFPYFGRSIKRQTAYILDNIGAVLEAAGSSLAHVVKATVFMPDSSDFQGLDEVWRAYFPKDPPARTVVPARTLFPDARLEINTIAITAEGGLLKETISTAAAPQPTVHHPQAVKAGDFVFLSGLLATDFVAPLAPGASINPAFPHHGVAARREAEYLLQVADTILRAGGSSLHRLARWQAYLSTLDHAGVLQEALRRLAGPGVPVGTVAQAIDQQVVPACSILLDTIGVVGE